MNKRVLFVSHEYSPRENGIVTYIDKMREGLEELGFKTFVMCPDSPELRSRGEDFILLPRPPKIPFLPNFFSRLFFSLSVLFWFLSSGKKRSFDCIENSAYFADLFFYVLIFGTKRVVIRVHSSIVSSFNYKYTHEVSRLDSFLCRRMESFLLRRSPLIITSTPHNARALQQVYSLERSLEIVPIPMTPLKSREFSASRNKNIVLFVGKLNRRKGADLVPAIMHKVLQENPEAQLIIVGRDSRNTCDGRSFWKQFLASLQMQFPERVSWHQYVPQEELERLYSLAGICLIPSRFESFGAIYYEAITRGAWVVAGRIDASVEVVEHEMNGLLFELTTPELAADHILRVQFGSHSPSPLPTICKEHRPTDLDRVCRRFLQVTNLLGS